MQQIYLRMLCNLQQKQQLQNNKLDFLRSKKSYPGIHTFRETETQFQQNNHLS